MNIDILDIITLDNDVRYVVSGKATYEGKNYIYIIAENNPSDVKFCEERLVDNKFHLFEVEDSNLIVSLLPLFVQNGVKAIKEVEN